MASRLAVASHAGYHPAVFGRDEFASRRFHYKPGQKVVFGGKSQESGKTTLAFKLLEYVATPEDPAYVIVAKPRDPVTEREGKRLGYRFTTEWPPGKTWGEVAGDKPSGYIIQAAYGDLDQDAARASAVSGAVMRDRYKAGKKHKNSIIVADDTVVQSKMLGHDGHMVTIIALGGAMGVGIWLFVQKATDSGKAAIWGFENAEHTFLSRSRDARNTERYGQIGGFDPALIEHCLGLLGPFQFLYLSGDHICIVDSQ